MKQYKQIIFTLSVASLCVTSLAACGPNFRPGLPRASAVNETSVNETPVQAARDLPAVPSSPTLRAPKAQPTTKINSLPDWAKQPITTPRLIARPGVLPTLPIPAWIQRPQGDAWSQITLKALADLGKDLLATTVVDTQDFCPRYNTLAKIDRARVWLALISSISLFESSFDPHGFFFEDFFNTAGARVVSRGLMQISRESANSYGCDIVKEVDLENPETNIRCAVRILNQLVSTDHSLRTSSERVVNNTRVIEWHGAARYWGVLRHNRKDATIRASVRTLPQC